MDLGCQVEGWRNRGTAEAVPVPGCPGEPHTSLSHFMDTTDSSSVQRLILQALKHLVIQWYHIQDWEGL